MVSDGVQASGSGVGGAGGGLWGPGSAREPSDPAEQDALTDEVVDRDLIDPVSGTGLAPMGVGSPVPGERFERFGRVLPRSVLRVWRRFGLEGFGRGLFWVTDPVEWEPVVSEWLDPVRDRLPFSDTFHCLARSAMGNLFLWGENSGDSLEVDPTYGEVIVDRLAVRSFAHPAVRQRQGRTLFTGAADRSVEEPEDESGRPLGPLALERLGPVGADQVYGFIVAPVLGGRVSVDNLRVVDAHAYLVVQAQQGEVVVSDPVGAAWGQVAPLIGADPTTSPGQADGP
ncbi:GAD-like domain-containing protein [Actinomyces wuliandei]|uniref:GAD-like domain-containing protein n=1 Tax=Actinomyces wuliandei TaxID=2057743 RepID=UPI000FD8801D|nr:GAD-like domain-containing protein [Actinomyces wuliandei]